MPGRCARDEEDLALVVRHEVLSKLGCRPCCTTRLASSFRAAAAGRRHSLPPRGPCPPRRARRRRRRPRRRRRAASATTRCATCRASSAGRTTRPSAARHGEGALRHGARGDDLVVRVPPGTQVTDWDGTAYDLVVPGTRVVDRARRPGRARQQALHDADAPGPAVRRARPARRRGLGRPAAQAARRRRPRRAAERRQVLAAVAADARRAEGRRLPVHDARAGARHARGRGAPARHRRHPRA